MNTANVQRRKAGRRRQRGAVIVLVAVAMVILVGMVAFAVDLGLIVTSKTQLQSAADAAALAGASTLVESFTLTGARNEAVRYAGINAPDAATDVSFGIWDPQTKTFTLDSVQPNAVRVSVERSEAQGNAVPSVFARIFGRNHFDISASSIAVGAIPDEPTTASVLSVYVTSTKDLSNVVLQFADGVHQKFDGLTGYTGTFAGTGANAGKTITGVWIKSGCYMSGDGPGYGEYLADPGDGTTVYGRFANKGCYARVSATFAATGVTFTDTGSASPVRLVQ